jgi:hypothetical protein
MNHLLAILMIFAIVLSEKPKQLEDLQWKNRIVLVFEEGIDSKVGVSESLLSQMQERKLAYFFIDEGYKSNVEVNFSKAYLEDLKKKFKIEGNKSSWLLIGLDGGVKMKGQGNLDWDLIFRTIDSMPMRQSELKSKKYK